MSMVVVLTSPRETPGHRCATVINTYAVSYSQVWDLAWVLMLRLLVVFQIWVSTVFQILVHPGIEIWSFWRFQNYDRKITECAICGAKNGSEFWFRVSVPNMRLEWLGLRVAWWEVVVGM